MKRTVSARSCFVLLLSTALLGGVSGGNAQSSGEKPARYVQAAAAPLPIDRGSAAVWQGLNKLHTRASLIMVVAHPDDEDGGMLTYEARGVGADATLMTLTRGEGGQNVMSSDYWDQLGILRTQELLAAGDYYGVHQYFASVADFGFSKTIEETLKTWGHDRVLYDVVRVIRMTRPLVITASFAGNVSDGHGQHQVSGVMAQEAFNAAADPKMFPDQIAAGLLPWAPLKVYARVPFARVSEKGIYDYATGHYEPVRFRNYATGTWIEGMPSTTVEIPESTYAPLLGSSYLTVGREGLSQQKSQNGGIGTPTIRPFSSPYHLYASRVSKSLPEHEDSFFSGIDTSLGGIADYAPAAQQEVWRDSLGELNGTVEEAIAKFDATHPAAIAPVLARTISQIDGLLAKVESSSLSAEAKYNMAHELHVKRHEAETTLSDALGLSLLATVANPHDAGHYGPFFDPGNQPSPQSVTPGESFSVNLHVADQSDQGVHIERAEIVPRTGSGWSFKASSAAAADQLDAGAAQDRLFATTVPANAQATKAYFSRPNLEQGYYDINVPRDLNLPTAPYPLTAEVTYRYQNVTATLTGVVQSVHRYKGLGPTPEPLLIAPEISVTISPVAGIVPLGNSSLHLQVKVHSSVKGQAAGEVKLQLPAGWRSNPESTGFSLANDGDEQMLGFDVMPQSVAPKPYTITAVAQYKGEKFTQGFEMTGYTGLRPYPFYSAATYRTTGVDVKVAPGLRVAYVAGTGDDVPGSLEDLGVHVNFLSSEQIASADLSAYDAVVLGIRAYAARPELRTFNDRLLEYARQGGTVVVQYQTGEFDQGYGPYPLTLSGDPEKVVEEDSPVSLAPNDPLLSWPNRITPKDFSGWVEERGHGFLREWDPRYTAPTEMRDTGQAPQRGGLVYTALGKGTYIYSSFAFFREMPEGVPGAFRLMANLISASRNPELHKKP